MHRIATAFILAVLIAASAFLFRLYRRTEDEAAGPGKKKGLLRSLEFTVESLGRFSYTKLALISIFGLFLEMLLIRWVSSEIRIFAYFKNFVLIACYLGFGLGCYLCRKPIRILSILLPLLVLTLLIKLPWEPVRYMLDALPTYLGVFGDVDMWGLPKFSMNVRSLGLLATAIAFTVPTFALLTFVFIPVGQLIGAYLEDAPHGIRAYTVNIVGSLAGILLFSALCFAYQPPVVWFAVSGLLLVPLIFRVAWPAIAAAVGIAICVGVASLNDRSGMEFWSPYQKLILEPENAANGELIQYHLTTNNSWYQRIVNLSPPFVAAHRDLLQGIAIENNSYNLPYRFYPNPPRTLVLGAGMGNDVAAALRNGTQQVVAVEIDPLILELGRRFHFEKPYDSPRVVQVVDDARSYIQNSRDQFDLICFSLLDSHTTTSHFSNIRIDNYVYTVEALQAARKLLKPDGLFVVKFQANTPWIAGRLQALLTDVFGGPPLQFVSDQSYSTVGRFFITGSQQRIDAALADRKLAEFVHTHGGLATQPASVTTDDWPYFYQHEPGVPSSVILISVVLVLLCMLTMRGMGAGTGAIEWHFFFLGAGFLLMEVQIVSKIALLFGTTWMVNSLAISGLLILIVAANLVVSRVGRISAGAVYAGLFLSLLLAYLVPVKSLFFANPWLRGVAATAVLCTPVFFAGLVFIRSFAEARFSTAALGSNLLGALVGGLLESLSLWTGLQSLLILAALLYLASMVTRRSIVPTRRSDGQVTLNNALTSA